MSTLFENLTAALACHQSGDRHEAERLYRRILDEDPGSADAWNLLGMLLHEDGRQELAASYIANAVRLEPKLPQFHNNLGNVLLALEQPRRAVLCYEQAIRADPRYFQAFTNLGNALQELQCPAEAVEWYQRSLERQPDCAQTWNCLGNALHALGRDAEAVSAFGRALSLDPASAEAHLNLGNVHFDSARYPEAASCYHEALRWAPRLVPALSNLGAALRPQRQFEEAERLCREALALAPAYPEAHSNLAAVLFDRGRIEDASWHAGEALRLKPRLAAAHVNSALVLIRQLRFPEAEAACHRALEIRPRYAMAYSTLGWALNESGRFAEARTALMKAIEIAPELTDACCNLGYLCGAERRYEEAFHWYGEVLRRDPSHAGAQFAMSLLHLLQGHFEPGWELYESRWRRPDVTPRPFSQPAWDGRPFPGRTILLYPEQGLGDTLQFVRYLPLVRQRGGRVILECQPGLAAFLRDNRVADEVVATGEPLPAFDCHAALLSLPAIVGTRLETIPGDSPYLSVLHGNTSAPGERLAAYGGFKAGLCWAGNAKHASDHLRSLSLAQLAPLAGVSGVTFFNLQRGPRAAELQHAPAGFDIVDLEDPEADLRHTAALIEGLDLVITADTMVAHLAGAMAKPVWNLLPYHADWRWMLDREDTPWYPTMRLFRQPAWNCWEPVIDRIRAELSLLSQSSR